MANTNYSSCNSDIKRMVHGHGVFLWQVAEEMGISEATLTRWLRVPFTDEQTERLKVAIDRIEKRNGAQ